MIKKLKEKSDALILREMGYSLNEISNKLNVSKSSVSIWVKDVQLGKKAEERISSIKKLARNRSILNRKRKIEQKIQMYDNNAKKIIYELKINKNMIRLMCSLIYFCEGAKDLSGGVRFINSDSDLVRTFVFLLRQSFDLDENKFRVCLHLHNYHDKNKQIKFWSEITDISEKKFIKPYFKINTGKRKRDNYQGCASIRYHDNNIARQLLSLAKMYIYNYGCVR